MTTQVKPLAPLGQVLAVFLLVSLLALPLLLWVQNATNLNPDILRLTQFSTAFGVLGVWCYLRLTGRKLALGGKSPQVQTASLALLLPILTLALNLILQRLAGTSFRWPVAADFLWSIPVMVGLQFLGALGEEVGWRGLVQPLLETRFSVFIAATITGLMFGAGHFYVLAAGLPTFILFLLSTVFLSWALAAATLKLTPLWRTLLAAFYHLLINLGIWVLPMDLKAQLIWTASLGVVGLCTLPLLTKERREKQGV